MHCSRVAEHNHSKYLRELGTTNSPIVDRNQRRKNQTKHYRIAKRGPHSSLQSHDWQSTAVRCLRKVKLLGNAIFTEHCSVVDCNGSKRAERPNKFWILLLSRRHLYSAGPLPKFAMIHRRSCCKIFSRMRVHLQLRLKITVTFSSRNKAHAMLWAIVQHSHSSNGRVL